MQLIFMFKTMVSFTMFLEDIPLCQAKISSVSTELDPGTSFIRLTPPNRLRAPERLTGEEQIRAFDKSSCKIESIVHFLSLNKEQRSVVDTYFLIHLL